MSQLTGSADVMSVHMQVSFVVTSLSAHCHSCMYCVLMCVEHTSDHDICLFKNIMFVFSDNLNYNGKLKKEGWDLKQLGSWETEKTMSSHLEGEKGGISKAWIEKPSREQSIGLLYIGNSYMQGFLNSWCICLNYLHS